MPGISRLRRLASAVAASAALGLALTACAGSNVTIDAPEQVEAAFPAETQEQLQAAVERAMVASGASGAIVGVWAPWSGSWVAGLGTTAPGDGSEVTADMRFPIADVTRAMTCDVLDAAVAQGKVERGDPVTEWVSGMAGYENVTLDQLCDSTSGIASYRARVNDRLFATPERVWQPKELASYGMGVAPTGEPGAGYANSDTGYVLLGLALERAMGARAAEYIQDRVAEPLQLESTYLPSPSRSVADAQGPVLNGLHSAPGPDGAMNCAAPVDMTNLSSSAGYTASGVVSDITDLGTYALALATGARPGGDDRFENPLPVTGDAPSWYTTTGGAYQAGSLIGQYGSIPGYITAAFADPTTGMTVAVVLNNSGATSAMGANLAWELAAITSKAPAAEGRTAPEAGLPWTAEQYTQAITDAAICAPAQ